MKTKVNGVVIELTPEQISKVNRANNIFQTVDEIISVGDACKLLKKNMKYPNNFDNKEDYVQWELRTLIAAANFIDNDFKEYQPDFNDRNTYKYLVWMEKKSLGWVFVAVYYFAYTSYCPVWLYFKKEATAKKFGKRFEKQFSDYMG